MSEFKIHLQSKITSKQARIGIYGLGYVGLPLAIRFAQSGFNVVGFDIDQFKIESLNQGKTYIKHISDQQITQLNQSYFTCTTDFSLTNEIDVLIICVPTPLDDHRNPDSSYVEGTLQSVLPHLRAGQILSLESTTYPGTTEEVILPKIESRGFDVGTDYFLVYSPEREDPGNANFNTQTIPKICGGHTESCLELGKAIYEQAIDKVVEVSSTQVAEFTKILENIHRAVNIGLVNEMKIVADIMGIDIYEVINAASTKPFGFTPYYPGPGLGGHCIPIDPFYLTWKAREYGIDTRFIELAGEVNTNMPQWVVSKVEDALKASGNKLNGARILVLGIAYKKNIDDMRESPSAELIKLLSEKGAVVDYSDPHVPSFPKMRKYSFSMDSIELTSESLSSYDCVLLATDHDAFDYQMIIDNAKLIVDTRGRYQKHSANLVKA